MDNTTFVVFEGKTDGKNPAGAYLEEDHARQSYLSTISRGLANRNVGLYFGRLDDLTDEEFEEVHNNTSALADAGFENFNFTVLESYESRIEDWDEAALSITDDDFDKSDENYKIS